ncbi:MAG: sulfite exporter TauE/SafE family protein [Candidatus Poribacteria bacterium]
MELLNHPFVQLAIVVTTGVCAGFLNTVAGGGSLLTLPVLIFLGLDGATMANGTNRVAIMIQNTVGVAGFRRKGVSDFRYGILIAIPAMIGAVMGALLVINLGKFDKNGVIFNRLLAIIMVGVLVITLSNPFKKFQSDVENLGAFRKILAVLLFFFLGIYMGFIQAGVGFMIIATLTIVNGFNLVRTNALKMFVVLFCTLVALIIFVINKHVDWRFGISLGVGNAAGAWIGSHWAVEKGDKWIRIVLVVTVSAFAIKLIWTSITHSIA